MALISYVRMMDGALYHGTLSDLDGKPLATWTTSRGAAKTTRDLPLSAADLQVLWQFANQADCIQRHLSTDPATKVDPTAAHIIALLDPPQDSTPRLYHVPGSERSPEFLDWLQRLNMPLVAAKPWWRLW